MILPASDNSSRRNFLKTTAAASTVVSSAIASGAHADGDDLIQLALVGCGGRGTGAAMNALTVDNGPVKVVAMADVFESNLANSHGNLTKRFGEAGTFDVPEERQFIGFDGYKKAMDCLKPGDIAFL